MVNTLIVDSVNLTFNNKKILSDIFLKCCTGDIIGVFGRNGCGKSSLLKVIFGTLNPENKFIRLNDNVIDCIYKVDNSISFLPQFEFIPKRLTVYSTIKLFIDSKNHSEFTNDSLLEGIINSKISTLSFGILKYLQVKLILYSESKFCMLDEPFSGLSPLFIELISEQIKKQSINKGIIITDHSYINVLKIVNKIYYIKNGKGCFLQNKSELFEYGYTNKPI
jgi:ABC-type multidrug transport system ATPase subunit